jgi:Na+-driven multidrug efflux pump
LVWPVLLEQVLGLSVGFTDKWLAGNLLEGAEYLAAVGLVAYCLGFLPGLFAVPAVAATALVSRSVGAGDLRGARRAATQAMLVAAALTAAVLGVVAVCGDSFVRALGLPSGSTALATRYLAIVLPALPAMMIIHVGVAVLRGAGDMWAGLLAMSVVNLVNAAASFALAVGAFGLPRLGWEGLAWGTAAGYCLGAVCVIGLLYQRGRGLRPARADWRPDTAWLGRILHVGVPAGVDAVANATCHLAFLSIVNSWPALEILIQSV